MPTDTEQMNEVIARFDGWEEWEPCKGRYFHPEKNITMFKQAHEFEYHSDWNLLHGAWSKLYAIYFKIEDHLKERRFYFDYVSPMKNALITSNITQAHKILFDAVEWVKNKNV